VRRGIFILFALTLGWALTTGGSTAAADTTVSLTFDDGNADQMAAKPILAEHDVNATFYIITGRVGLSNFFTWGNVASLFADGNEMGGHTTNHQHLTQIPPDQARDAICDARQDLLARGYPQVSFAYPFGQNDATTAGLVEECGYASGRDVTSIAQWPGAETIPPLDPWAVRTPGSIDMNDTLSEIEDWIMDAEQLGETSEVWVPLVFHHLCDPVATPSVCSDPNGVDGQYITPSDFDALLDWLEARESLGTNVKTVAQVIDPDTEPPTSQVSCDGTIEIAPPPGQKTLGSPCATLVSVRSLPNGTAKISFRLSVPGRLDAASPSSGGASAGAAGRRRPVKIRSTSKQAQAAGEVTLRIVANKAGKRVLRRKGKLTVPVRVTFTPRVGSPVSGTIEVRLRIKRPKA
jgi:Polysaccharide deacetylase